MKVYKGDRGTFPKEGKRERRKCSADAKRNYREYSRTSIRSGKLRRFCVWGCDRTKNTI